MLHENEKGIFGLMWKGRELPTEYYYADLKATPDTQG